MESSYSNMCSDVGVAGVYTSFEAANVRAMEEVAEARAGGDEDEADGDGSGIEWSVDDDGCLTMEVDPAPDDDYGGTRVRVLKKVLDAD